ncbi:hypothetical protein HP532_06210 [Pseudomonas sp. CrR25]|nr:hypothetical protein [Pseudomonas sp. CrR25]
MTSDEFDEVDLRYLQCGHFMSGPLQDWIRPRNPFKARMAANLRPGLAVWLDLKSVVEVLGGAAHAMPGKVINVSLQWQGDQVRMVVCSIEPGMPPICADDAGSLLPALHWYRAQGEAWLQLSVIAPAFFWFPLHLLARSSLDEPAGSNH